MSILSQSNINRYIKPSKKQVPHHKTAPVTSPADKTDEENKDKANSLNSILGASFKCNVCNKYHHKDSRAVVNCLKKIIMTGTKIALRLPSPAKFIKVSLFASSLKWNLFGGNLCSMFLTHPVILLNYGIAGNESIECSVKDIKHYRVLLTIKDEASRVNKFSSILESHLETYKKLKNNINIAIERAKQYDYNLVEAISGLNLDINKDFYNYDNYLYNSFIPSKRAYINQVKVSYYYGGLLYTYYNEEPDTGNELITVCRVSLVNRYLPKFLPTDMLDKVNHIPETDWQVLEEYKYD